LRNKDSFKERNAISLRKIEKIRDAFDERIDSTKYADISVYCGGSLGRGDVGNKSDLDLFILSNKRSRDLPRIDTLDLLSTVININKELGYPQFSNDGQYLQVYSFPDMLNALGSPVDDIQNLFTVRMLLLLESRPIFNDKLYDLQITNALEHYFRDSRGKESYRPLFLVNDILRYWRTVCLNYELIRNDINRPWRKKNINLKFSRMLTAFATILPLIAEPASTKDCVYKWINFTPLERLAYGLDYLNDDCLKDHYNEFLAVYEEFLILKEHMGSKRSLDDASVDTRTKYMEKTFSWFLHECLTHRNISKEYRKYLIL
jgi:predicted nucleotidyltransferase